MKYFATFLAVFLFSMVSQAQQTLDLTLTHDGIERAYKLYVPATYTGNEVVPLVFNFHGYGSNAGQQMFYGDFRAIADTANFIIAHPEGTLLAGTSHFNVGGFTLGSTVDDVGFTEAMIDAIAADYAIDLNRVYSTGMSNGGFMSFLLACQLSDKIAAVASVTGSMTPETYNACDAQHPTPVLQIHGTNDGVVPYLGNILWTYPVEDVVAYWVGFNHCNEIPTTTDLTDINTSDASTVEHFVYDGGDNGVFVEHYKVAGGDHTWPGAAINIGVTNQDFSASAEIWKFFSQYNLNDLVGTNTSIANGTGKPIEVNIYPNPASSKIFIDLNTAQQVDYELLSALGKVVLKGTLQTQHQELDIADLPANLYFLKIGAQVYKVMKGE